MQRSKSPSVSQDKFNSSKSVKFSFTSTPARKESPSRTQSNKMSKSQQSFQPAPKPQRAASPKPMIPPPHSLTKKKEEEPTRYNSAMRSSNGQSNTTMYKSIPNPMSQSFSPQKREAKLQDLCNEDKQKIGDLIKKLAEEKEEKEKLRRELDTRDNHYKHVIQNLAKENDFVVKDSIELQNQFKYSLNLLKNFQEISAKQQKQKEKEAKRERKLRKQQEEQERYQQYLQQQEQQRQQQERDRQQDMEQRRYEQQVQKHEFRQQQEKQKQQEFEKQQKLQQEQEYQKFVEKQQYQPLSYTQIAQPSTNETRRNISSPLVKPKEVKEGSPYLDSNNKRQLIQPAAGQAAQTFRNDRVDSVRKSPTKKEVDEAVQREERVMSEIQKIKEDIENLTHSFKKMNFTSNDSSEVQHQDRSRNQLLVEPKSNSPIKLMQNFKSAGSSAQRQQQRRQTEEEFYQEELYPQTLPVRPEVQRESPAKAPLMKRGTAASLSTANAPHAYEADPGTSSDEDELAVAQKWLNLRKEKLRNVNQQLGENREQREAYQEVQGIEKDSLNSEGNTGQPEEEAYYYEQQEPQRRQVEYQSQEVAWSGGREGAHQQKNINAKSSPSFRDINTGRFVSERKREGEGSLNQNSLRRAPNSGARVATDPAVVNLNQLTVDEMIKLKSVLEEKLHGEKQQQELINSKVEFAIRSPEKPKSLLNPTNYQTFSYQGTIHPELSKSGSGFKNSKHTEYEYTQGERYGKSGRTIHSEANEYERGSGFKESSRKGLGDSSIVRDFDSIAYTRPESYKLTETYKDTEGYGLVTEAPRTLEDESSQMEEYEEKLQEFLKVRDRLIKQNKIRSQGVEIENMFFKNQVNGSNEYGSAQQSHQTNSPPSVRSVGRLEAPRTNDRDLMKQVLQNQGMDYNNYNSRGNARFFREEGSSSKAEALEEAKTPDYGYGTSQRSQKTEAVSDDFYDENLFELVDDIEMKESAKPTPSKSTLETKSTARVKGLKEMKDIKKVENEFNSLFNTMRSMFTNNEDNTTTERIRDKLLSGFGRSDLVASKISSEDEDHSESYSNLPQQMLDKGNERRASDLSGHFTHGRPSKTDSSIVETDTSILAITKKIDELKKIKKNQKK